MTWDQWSTGVVLVVVLVHVCSRGTVTSITVGSVGYGTASGTSEDMNLVLVWAQGGTGYQWRRSRGTAVVSV